MNNWRKLVYAGSGKGSPARESYEPLQGGYDRHLPRELSEGVTYAKFAALAKRMGWQSRYLADILRGRFELGKGETFESYFERILNCGSRNDQASPDTVIVYRSIIEKFLKTVAALAADNKLTLCPCGCGSYPGAGGRLAWDSCTRQISLSPAQLEVRRQNAEKGRTARRTYAADRRERKRLIKLAAQAARNDP